MYESSRFRFHRETVHPIISVAFATLATWALALLIGDVLPPLRQSFILYLLIGIYCVEEAVVGNTLQEERAGALARVREFLIVVLSCYVVLGALRPGNIITRYFPTIETVYPVVLAAFGWLLAAGLHKRLRSREEFLRATGHVKREDLHRATRDLTAVSVGTLRDLRGVRGLATSIVITLTVLLVAAWAVSASFRVVTFLALTATFVQFLLILGLTSLFSDEFIYLGDSLRIRRVDVRRKLVFAGLLIAGSVAFALIAASDRSLLSLDVFRRFFEWLGSLIPQPEAGDGVPLSLSNQRLQQLEALRQLEEMMQDQEPSRFLLALLRTIRSLVIAAAMVGLLVLVFGPFLTDEFADMIRTARPLEAVLRRLRGFALFLRRMYRVVRRWWRHVDISALFSASKDAGASETDVEHAPRAHRLRKRRQMSRISQLFLRLIEWSTERGCSYRKSHVPTEYGRRLSAAFPTLSEEIDLAIEIFEESMYSRHALSRRRIRTYAKAVERITRTDATSAG